MGLNLKDIHLRLFRVVQVTYDSSYKFLQSHPKISCVLLVCIILYIFLSYIYTFLVYMSPFFVCAAIFLRIFWSSEQPQLRYVKREEEKVKQKKRVELVEQKCPPKIPTNDIGRRELVNKFASRNAATSRRRNFRENKKWDVYGGLEEKAKDLSAVFQNEFTKRNIDSFEKGESSFYYGLSGGRRIQVPKRQTTLRSEPSMIDLVECVDKGIEKEKIEEEVEEEEEEEEEDEEEEDAHDEDRNIAIEWTENDQKNLMDLGVSEMERNKRLESLIARRRERKLLKLQLENGLIDKKSIAPSLIIPRGNNAFDSSNDIIDGLEMPGSAPSFMPRSPYDFPYEPSEEKPNLTGDTFLQEYNKMAFCRHESFSSFSRFRKLPDKGNHDWLIEQLIYNEGGEKIQEPNPMSKGEETTHEEDVMKDEKGVTAHETKSMSDQTSEISLVPNITNVDTVSEKPGLMPRFSRPHERLLNLPVSANTTTKINNTINESLYDNIPSPIDKRQETMFLTDRRLSCHTPTYSIASDLQVEFSEIGSQTSTVDDENDETNSSSSTDRDSVLYDGDIDRDVSSGSEDLWGASFHGRRNEGDSADEDVNNNLVSPCSLRQIDEENVADISSYSSRSDMPEDTPTSSANNDDHNISGYLNYSAGETEAPQSSNSSVDQLPNETHSGKQQQEWCNMSENLTNESEVIINDVNNTATTEQGNIENSTSNEDPGPSTSVAWQESMDEASIYSISSSPRSVLPDKTLADDVSSSSALNQQIDRDAAQQSNMEDVAQENLNGENPPADTMPQNIQPLMDDINDHESHNVEFNHSLEQTDPIENSIEEANIFGNMNDGEICRKEEQDKLNNEENSEDNSTHQINQEGTSESTREINKMTTIEDVDEKSRDLVDDKVPVVEADKNELPASSNINIHEELPQPWVTEATVPGKEANEGHAEDS